MKHRTTADWHANKPKPPETLELKVELPKPKKKAKARGTRCAPTAGRTSLRDDDYGVKVL